jgi:hypothetical protein
MRRVDLLRSVTLRNRSFAYSLSLCSGYTRLNWLYRVGEKTLTTNSPVTKIKNILL